MTIAEATMDMRHLMVKLVAPRIYEQNYIHHVRPMITFLKSCKLKNLVGAEIGVYKGANAESILKNLSIKHLYLIDPYAPFFNVIRDRADNFAPYFLYAQKRLALFKDKVSFVKMRSQDAVSQIPNNLDFVYVDGNHDYEFVKRDLELYYPKVRKGGVLGGHDFAADHYDVAHAVVSFASKHGLTVYGAERDWWIIKEEQKGETETMKFSSLDVGCGGGRFRPTYLGDINIDILKPNPKPCKPFIQCDALHLPFKTDSFAKVTMFDVLEHVNGPAIVLSEVKRVLAKDGILILGTPNAMRILKTLFLMRYGFYIPHPAHISTWGRMELENLMRQIGFSKFKVVAQTYKDEKHSFVANLLLRLPWKDLTERQLVVVAKK